MISRTALYSTITSSLLFFATDTPVLASITPDPERVAAAKEKKLDEVNLGWWPNLHIDATDAFHEAFASGAKRVIVPNIGQPYTVKPLLLQSDNQEIIFEKGAEVLAAAGEFHGLNDSLISMVNRKNIRIIGYGATLRMRKADYQGNDYARSEWRMGLRIQGSDNILIEGLTIADTGGDGIYIAPAMFRSAPYPENSIEVTRPGASGQPETLRIIPASTNITVRKIIAKGNHRQGISVISGKNILVEDSIFEDTRGTAPASGFDVEPNSPTDLATNIVVRNCIAKANEGHGFLVYLRKMNRTTEPVSIVFENCTVLGSEQYGLVVGGVGDQGVLGNITFRNCVVKDTEYAGIYVFDKSVEAAHVLFEKCDLENVAIAKTSGSDSPEANNVNEEAKAPPIAPVVFFIRRLPDLTEQLGGITFLNCSIKDDGTRPVVASGDRQGENNIYLSAIDGDIAVPSLKPPLRLGRYASKVALQLVPNE